MSEPTPEELAGEVCAAYAKVASSKAAGAGFPELTPLISAALRAARLEGWEQAREACKLRLEEEVKDLVNEQRDACDRQDRDHATGGRLAINKAIRAIAALTPPEAT